MKNSNDIKVYLIPLGISTLFLLGAVFIDWPYGYYTFLRFVVCVSLALCAFKAWVSEINWLGYSYAAIAVIYNPIIRIHLTKDIWQVINVLTIIAFIILISITKIKYYTNVQKNNINH